MQKLVAGLRSLTIRGEVGQEHHRGLRIPLAVSLLLVVSPAAKGQVFTPNVEGFYYTITNAAATAGYDVSTLTNTTATYKEAVAAYFWGYPLEEMWREQQLIPNNYGFQVNQLFAPGIVNNSTTVVAPNMNVLNATGFLDLSGNNAFVLTVPNTTSSGTYNIMQMLNAYTDVTYSFGTRNFQTGTLNNSGGNYLLVGPNYSSSSAVPTNITAVVTNATAQAWMIGRVQVDPYVTNTLGGSNTPYNTLAGGATNVFSPENSKAIVQSYGLTSLTNFLAGQTTLPVTTTNATGAQQLVAAQNTSTMTGQKFYEYVGTNVAYSGLNSVGGQTNNQAAMYANFSGIGLTTNGYTAPDASTQATMNLAASNAAAMLTQMANNTTLLNTNIVTSTGWVVSTTAGSYTNTYQGWLNAAVTAKVGLGANLATDATYPQTTVDSQGNALNGSNPYTMTFAPGQMPPVEGFWSLTVYDLAGNVVSNTGNTFYGDNVFSISSMQMINVLGSSYDTTSVSLLLQSQAPTDSSLMPYWLPTPAGQDFELILRMYFPDGTSSSSSILNGSYTVPGVNLVPEPSVASMLLASLGSLIALRHRRKK